MCQRCPWARLVWGARLTRRLHLASAQLGSSPRSCFCSQRFSRVHKRGCGWGVKVLSFQPKPWDLVPQNAQPLGT